MRYLFATTKINAVESLRPSTAPGPEIPPGKNVVCFHHARPQRRAQIEGDSVMVARNRWAAYARQQAALSRSTSLTDRYWGLEAAMNGQLDAADESQVPLDVERQIATAARRTRHRKRLLTVYGPSALRGEDAVEPGADASLALRTLARKMNVFDFRLLVTVACGVKPATIAKRLTMSSSAVRQRVSRARRANVWVAG
jgi:hypothetical protein